MKQKNSRDVLKVISILGCGWYGLALANKLIKKGYIVKGSTTSPEKLNSLREGGVKAYQINFSTENHQYDADFFDCDILFITIPPNRKKGEAIYFPLKIEAICKAASLGSTKQLILISSIGVYGKDSKDVNELDLPQANSESGNALLAAENIVKAQKDFTATIIRFGGLFGPKRNPGRFFAGKKSIANGLAPVNMIHLSDCLGISLAILERQAFGQIYNACSPQHPNRAEFYTRFTKESGLELPEFIPEFQEWKIVNSINVPKYLDYKFVKSFN